MKVKNMLIGLVAITVLALPAISLANIYQFIDTSGNIQSVEANSFTEALNNASPLGIHSGVMLVSEGGVGGASPLATQNTVTTPTTTGTGNYYQFIDTSGNIQGLWAANSTEALNNAYPLGIHSGVVLSN